MKVITKKIYVFKIYVEKFFKTIGTKYLTLVNEFLLRSTFIQNEIEDENTVTSRIRTPCKTYIQSSYSDDNITPKKCPDNIPKHINQDIIRK